MFRHKKCVLLLLLCFLVISVGACATRDTGVAQNHIAPTSLTGEQEEFAQRISILKQEIALFDFATDGTFSAVEVWLERYEYGVSTQQWEGVSIFLGAAHSFEGQLSIFINGAHEESTVWAFGLLVDGAFSQNTLILPHGNQDGVPHGMTRFVAPRYIEAGEEIILLENHFSREPGLPTEGLEMREASSYSYVLKARFG